MLPTMPPPESLDESSEVLILHNNYRELSYIRIELGHFSLASDLSRHLVEHDFIGPTLTITTGHDNDVWLINNACFGSYELNTVQDAVGEWIFKTEGTIPDNAQIGPNTWSLFGKEEFPAFVERWRARNFPLIDIQYRVLSVAEAKEVRAFATEAALERKNEAGVAVYAGDVFLPIQRDSRSEDKEKWINWAHGVKRRLKSGQVVFIQLIY